MDNHNLLSLKHVIENILGFDEQPPRLGHGPAQPSRAGAAAGPAWLPPRFHRCSCQFPWQAAELGADSENFIAPAPRASSKRASEQQTGKKSLQTGNPAFQASCTPE